MSDTTILLLGVYGMEMVECGGVLAKNVVDGGKSVASIMFAGDKMKEDLTNSAKLLNCELEFTNFDIGTITATVDAKMKIANTIRRIKPDIIITQDPEHMISDLDPGRRPAMSIILEGMAIAGRQYQVDQYEPWSSFSLYYMTPDHPNCLVDIESVWDQKVAAMDALKNQLMFIKKFVIDNNGMTGYEKLIPELSELSDYEGSKQIKRWMDLVVHMYPGATGHNHTLLSECYRKEGMFELQALIK